MSYVQKLRNTLAPKTQNKNNSIEGAAFPLCGYSSNDNEKYTIRFLNEQNEEKGSPEKHVKIDSDDHA